MAQSVEASGKIVEGVFAIHKPTGISSAQVLRDVQHHFDPSALFAPWLAREASRRDDESYRQKKKRRGFKRQNPSTKIGHGGTLDPLATGVLIAGVGKGTKHLSKFLECTKSYECVVLFGAATDTYDRLGKIIGRKPFAHVTEALVREKLGDFKGKIMQRPPLYSALKVQGKALYAYAREGKEVPQEIKERPVEVVEMEMVEWMEGGKHEYQWPKEEAPVEDKKIAEEVLDVKDEDGEGAEQANKAETEMKAEEAGTAELGEGKTAQPEQAEGASGSDEKTTFMSGALEQGENSNSTTTDLPPAARIRMTVTSGFYVRSLCHDLGEKVGSLALMSELIRTRQGEFQLGKNVLEYDDLAKGEEVWGSQVEAMLEEWDQKHPDTENGNNKKRSFSRDSSRRQDGRYDNKRRRNSSSEEIDGR